MLSARLRGFSSPVAVMFAIDRDIVCESPIRRLKKCGDGSHSGHPARMDRPVRWKGIVQLQRLKGTTYVGNFGPCQNLTGAGAPHPSLCKKNIDRRVSLGI